LVFVLLMLIHFLFYCLFFLSTPPSPRSTLFPYTTLFRSSIESSLKSSAQYFGTKSSESIQNNPGAFKTTQDGDLLYILWNPGDHLPLLLRVDDTSTNITNVYIYNKHGDNPKGRHLYTGRTIVQK